MFILVSAKPEGGDEAFQPIKPSHKLWMLCGPLTRQLIGHKHHFLD